MSETSNAGHRLAEIVAETVCKRFCHPTATYRIQFEKEHMTFRDAAAIIPYLSELGISHLYASPYLKTGSSSTNAYAIVDYTRLNPDLGDESDYRAMIDAKSECPMERCDA